jgi:hypothetical protein
MEKLKPDYIRRPKKQRSLFGDFFGHIEEYLGNFDYRVRVYYGIVDFDNLDNEKKIWYLNKKKYSNISLRSEIFDHYNERDTIKMIFEDPIGVE